MNQSLFSFDASFNEFLAPERRGAAFEYYFQGHPTLKHLIEAMRIPHTEVGRVSVNNQDVSLAYQAQDGDHIVVHPNRRQHLESTTGFILDNHLGKLASYLRMLGFDTLYRNDYQDDELAALASQEQRVLLTRDRGLLMRREIEHGYSIRSMEALTQVIEVLQRYDLFDNIRPFQRCLRCNGLLRTINKSYILERLEPLTQKYYQEFSLCQQCDQIYWKGSHYERMLILINQIKSSN